MLGGSDFCLYLCGMTDKSRYVRFDWAIKRILRDKANKEVLEGLITVLLGEAVTITEILETENNKNRFEDKGNRVDVKAKTAGGEYIIVEVQLTKERDFFQRILFGTATSITDQIGMGQDYSVIRKIYSINILYFDFGSGDDYAYHGVTTFHGMTKKDSVLRYNTKNEEKYIAESTRRMTMPEEVFPEYFLLLVSHFNEVAKTPIEEWMEYLKDAVIREDTTVPGLQAARQKLAIMSMTEKEFREYRDYMVSVHAAKDSWDTMRDEARAEGRAEGLAEGHAEGLAEGRAKGLAEGLAEGHAKGRDERSIEIARKMKAKGKSVEEIAELTDLSVEEIESL